MLFEITEAVYFILVQDKELKNALFNYFEQNHEKVFVCNSIDDFIFSSSYYTGNESSFVTYFIETTPDVVSYVQEQILMKVGFPGEYPVGVFLFNHEDSGTTYDMPHHVQNSMEYHGTIDTIDPGDIDFTDASQRLLFLDMIKTKNNKMRFYLHNQIVDYNLVCKVENNSQSVMMLREDVTEVINPDKHNLEEVVKKSTKVDFTKITEDLREALKSNTHLKGGIDWLIAHTWVNRAKYMVTILLTMATFGLYFSGDIYKFYNTIDFIFTNKYEIHRMIKKEKLVETKKIKEEVKKGQ